MREPERWVDRESAFGILCYAALELQRSFRSQAATNSHKGHRVGNRTLRIRYGELRIESELLERGVDRSLISAALAPFADEWPERLAELHRRRFGEGEPTDAREWQRRARFLTGRGFRAEAVRRLLGE